MKTFHLEISKKGLPCLWESGGGASNTGSATIIAGPTGNPIAPIYIRRSGQLSNGDHALIPVEKDFVVIEADHHRGDFTIKISRLTGIRREDPEKGSFWEAHPVAEFSNGEWDHEEAASAYAKAIEAAKAKATCYHCREPYFVKTISPDQVSWNKGENFSHAYRDGECIGGSGNSETPPRAFCSVCGSMKTWHGHPHCDGDQN